MRRSIFDGSGKTRRLRRRIGERVISNMRSVNRVEFLRITSNKLGINTTTMDSYLTALINGRRDGSTKKESGDYTFSPTELRKINVVFDALGIDTGEPVIEELISAYPKFREIYSNSNQNYRYIKLLRGFDEIVSKQTNEYIEELRERYSVCETDKDRREFINSLEGDLNFMKDEGIFKTLLK